MSTLPPLTELVSLIPRAPRMPTFPTEAEIQAHYIKIDARNAELAWIESEMNTKREQALAAAKTEREASDNARTVRPVRKGK